MAPVANTSKFLRSVCTPRPPATMLNVEYANIPNEENRSRPSPRID